jgi:hypothetical protein
MYVLVSQSWMMVIPYTKEFKYVYLHPLAFAGVFHLPVIQNEWPQTAGIDIQEIKPMQILKDITYIAPPPPPPVVEENPLGLSESVQETERVETELPKEAKESVGTFPSESVAQSQPFQAQEA